MKEKLMPALKKALLAFVVAFLGGMGITAIDPNLFNQLLAQIFGG